MGTVRRTILAALVAVAIGGAAAVAAVPAEKAEAGSWGGCAVSTYREHGWLLLSPLAFSFAWQSCWTN